MLEWGSQGKGLKYLVITYLSLFQKHVEAQEKISPVSQTLPYLSLLSWAHPPQSGMNQAGKAVLDPHQRICVQGFSISGDHSLQGGRGKQLLLGEMQKSSPALGAAHTPYTDVNQRLTMDQTVVQGIQQAHSIFFQDHQHVLALPRTES